MSQGTTTKKGCKGGKRKGRTGWLRIGSTCQHTLEVIWAEGVVVVVVVVMGGGLVTKEGRRRRRIGEG
jgi:hypothetical protein